MARRRRGRNNPLDPYAFDTEQRPFSAPRRPITRAEQVGVHVTSDFDRACVYAMQRAHLQGDSIGIIFVLDMAGLEALPDVDAVIQSETHDYAAGDVLSEVESLEELRDDNEDATPVDAIREAIGEMLEAQEFDGEMPPDTWLDGAYAALDAGDQARLFQVLSGLDNDTLLSVMQFAVEQHNFPLEVWAAVVQQWRFMVQVGADRLVEVLAVRPVRHDLWGRGPDDPDLNEQEYPDDDPGAPQIFTDIDFADERWTPDTVTLWSSGRKPREAMYHGTDLTRARRAFPELQLDSPWEYTQE